ncbi:APE1 Vacuolar aminopeptidase 1 [Candida maltosa Xu316]|uniref:Vacuolar aminopeptidase 1 n=1 Tax=Candida maltosa (strain Xu316) TaxID=1245528 RepID=M3HGP8_CANMX|nr:hypothetical protein G210_3307 [Candida maltosa Xu316]
MSTTPETSDNELESLSTPDISTIESTDIEDNEYEDQDLAHGTILLDSNYVFKVPDMSQTISQLPTPKESFRDYYETYSAKYIDFMTNNPTTNHTITHFKSLLENNGFTYLPDTKKIENLTPGFYFTSKDDQSLIAFVIGGKWEPSHGSCFIGSHCDALTVKLNPRGSLREKIDGYELLGVAPYSGSLNRLWLNRDLGLAGSVLVRDERTGKVSRKLINSSPDPIAFIPQLAPHFGISKDEYNPQTEMVPICGFSNDDEELIPTDEEKKSKFYGRHSLALLRYISQLSNTPLSQIIDFDLDLVDVQPSHRGGLNNEFIYSGCLDDRLCAFTSVYGLIEYSQRFYLNKDVESYDGLSGIYLANNEEIGSGTRTGAKGGFFIDILKSIVSDKVKFHTQEAVANLTTNTIFLSTDVTHALNPNFKDVYLDKNFPVPNTGPSIKFDSNGHVLSDSKGNEFLTRIIDELPGIKLQHFHIRNDSRSGGTIGPIMSDSKRGINGAKLIIDVGLPILSMHSIRSIAGYKDVGIGIRFFKQVLSKWQTTINAMEQ